MPTTGKGEMFSYLLMDRYILPGAVYSFIFLYVSFSPYYGTYFITEII